MIRATAKNTTKKLRRQRQRQTHPQHSPSTGTQVAEPAPAPSHLGRCPLQLPSDGVCFSLQLLSCLRLLGLRPGEVFPQGLQLVTGSVKVALQSVLMGAAIFPLNVVFFRTTETPTPFSNCLFLNHLPRCGAATQTESIWQCQQRAGSPYGEPVSERERNGRECSLYFLRARALFIAEMGTLEERTNRRRPPQATRLSRLERGGDKKRKL